MAITEAEVALRERDVIVHNLYSNIRMGGGSLKSIPKWVELLIEQDAWKERYCIATHEIVRFERFSDFLKAELPEGLDMDFQTIWRLCSDRPDIQARLDELIKTPHGGDRKSQSINLDNIQLDSTEEVVSAPTGTSRAAGLRKLRKHSPELLQRVTTGEVSVNQALIQAGLREKAITIPCDPVKAANRIKRNFSPEEIKVLIEVLLNLGN